MILDVIGLTLFIIGVALTGIGLILGGMTWYSRPKVKEECKDCRNPEYVCHKHGGKNG